METSLHRQLKQLYADDGGQVEARLGAYRIDVLRDHEVVEIQHGSLGAIRAKINRLLETHNVRVVKPIIATKQIIKRARRRGKVVDQRKSPKRGSLLSVFDELVYFTSAFPHPRLVLEVAMVEVEEWRVPGHGRRRRWRRGDHVVEDQKLLSVLDRRELRTPADLLALLGCALPGEFHTGQLAEQLSVPRDVAQRIAYCLRQTGAIEQLTRRKTGWVYGLPELRTAA